MYEINKCHYDVIRIVSISNSRIFGQIKKIRIDFLRKQIQIHFLQKYPIAFHREGKKMCFEPEACSCCGSRSRCSARHFPRVQELPVAADAVAGSTNRSRLREMEQKPD